MSLLTSPALELQILWHAWHCGSICLGGVGFCLSWADSWQYGCCLLLCCCLLISCVWYDLYLGWWREAWYIDECLLLMWLLCPALDLYVISEIVHLLRFVKGAGWWCGFLMFLSYVRPSFPSLKKLHRGHCHTYLSSSSWRFFMSSFFLRYCCFLETLYFRLCALSVHTYWYLHTVWDTCYFYLHLSK